MDLTLIRELEDEITRFDKKLNACKKRLISDSFAKYGCKETGALKRAALDLKMELTKITR